MDSSNPNNPSKEGSKKSTYIIAAVSLLVIAAAVYFLFIFQKSPKKPPVDNTQNDVKNVSEIDVAKRPFVTLTPTSNGAEIIMTLQNMGDFDKIEYELTYLADNPQIPGQKIERGATGTDVDPKSDKYEKSVLLGTASKGVRSPDQGITDGKLTLHLFKGDTEYRSETPWDLIEAGTSKAQVKDRDSKVVWNLPSLGKDYWIIIADTVGVPPQNGSVKPSDVSLPVYGTFSVAPQFSVPAQVSVNVSGGLENPQLYSYNVHDGTWQKIDSTYDSSAKTLSAKSSSFTTLVISK